MTFNATISAAAPGSTSGATPTGTPTWTITGQGGASATCASTSTGTHGSNETASCGVAAGQLVASGSPYIAKVTYPGDANFNAGSGTYQENVQLGTSSVKVHIGAPATQRRHGHAQCHGEGDPDIARDPDGDVAFVITDKHGNAGEL